MIRFWFGSSDYISLTMNQVFGSGNVNIVSNNTFRITINTSNIESIITQQGRNYDDCTYTDFEIGLITSQTLFSTKYYRWSTECFYESETASSTKLNFWNPNAEYSPSGPSISPLPYPTAQIKIIGTQTGQTSLDNALNEPYWYFPNTDSTGSIIADPTSSLNILQLSSSNGNNLYGSSFQKTMPYVAASSSYFPGNFEPEDTTWPQQRLPFTVEIGDEIRFANNESEAYKILKVTSPSDNEALTSQGGTGKFELRLLLDRQISPNINKDFFLVRRYVDDASTILIESKFPYPGVGSNTIVYNPNTFSGSMTSASYQSIPPEKLKKSQLTTSAIVFPVYPTEDINNQPDLLLDALRNNKLID